METAAGSGSSTAADELIDDVHDSAACPTDWNGPISDPCLRCSSASSCTSFHQCWGSVLHVSCSYRHSSTFSSLHSSSPLSCQRIRHDLFVSFLYCRASVSVRSSVAETSVIFR